jgi:hypothetical protein
VAPTAPPPAAPPPARPVAAAPPPPAPPPPRRADWRDWPLTPGDWRYARAAQGASVASFGGGGAPLLSLRCEGGGVTFALEAPASSATVRSSTMARSLALTNGAARLAPGDALLDAIGFSRGRFVVETPGAPALVIPAYPEILRLIEDCRG